MQKITSKGKLILYACSGLGVNMLGLIVGSYLCSALLVGGFESHVEEWTYLSKDLVVAGLWAVLILLAKIVDGVIDIPLSHFTDNLKTPWGKRRPALVLGLVPMLAAYLLFLLPLTKEASLLNTLWFALLLLVFYTFYTLTMLTFYATFAEITEKESDIALLSNVKSVCDVVYFILGYALVPAFVSMNLNIRVVALLFLPLSLTMLIPFFLLKEQPNGETKAVSSVSPAKEETPSLGRSLVFALKDKPFLLWLCILFVMNMGLQLFLSGINEFFSTTGLNMTFIMASCFVPVPFTVALYNHILKKKGLGFAFRYILLVFSVGMLLLPLCEVMPETMLYPFAIFCSLIVSLSIGAFFSVTYTAPSHRAALRKEENESSSSMYFAIQGLFEGASAGLASGVLLVFLKQSGLISTMPLIVAAACLGAFFLSFLLPESIRRLGKTEE